MTAFVVEGGMRVRVLHADATDIPADLSGGQRCEGFVGEAISFYGVHSLSNEKRATTLASRPVSSGAALDGNTLVPDAPGRYRVEVVAGPEAVTVEVVVFPREWLEHRLVRSPVHPALGPGPELRGSDGSIVVANRRERPMRDRRLIARSLVRDANALTGLSVEALTPERPMPPGVNLALFGAGGDGAY